MSKLSNYLLFELEKKRKKYKHVQAMIQRSSIHQTRNDVRLCIQLPLF